MAIQPASRPADEVALPTAASEAVIQRAATALRANNIEVLVVDTADEARDAVLARVPEGSEVHSGKSMTLEEIGVFAALHEPGRYDAIRPKLQSMDRSTQGREMRKLGAVPDTIVGSVNAITEDGVLIAVSATGNQLAAYAGGAGRVILVVGSQKFVPDLETAFRRIRDVVFPYEDARVRSTLGVGTKLEKALVIFGEWLEGRTTVVIVR
ncbi:MAG TPA: lactate utilization protein, partial [Candidatus Limnocylindrales bacterium]|nr:lactate utilization protein [Candidatus Limnocylindrales bacterium]